MQTSLRNIFRGSQGLRSGWGAAIFIIVFAMLVAFFGFGLITFMRARLPTLPLPGADGPQWPISTGLGELTLLFAVLGATWTISLMEHRSFSQYGFSLERSGSLLRFGAFCGFAILSSLLGCLVLMRAYSVSLDPSPLVETGLDGTAWACVALLFGLTEESLFRGYLLATLARSLGFWWASLVTSVLFALAHVSNQGEMLFGLISAGGAGLVLCFSIWKSGSIWWATGWHAAWNWGESFFYGTPNSGKLAKDHLLTSVAGAGSRLSGGTVGPEGSYLVFGALLLSALIISFCLSGPNSK